MAGTTDIGSGATKGQQVFNQDELAYGLGSDYDTCGINGTTFIPTSLPVQLGGDLKEYKDNTGRTCSLVVPESFQTITISGYLIKHQDIGTGASIKKGDEVTGLPTVQGMKTGVTWRLQDYSVQWQNEDVAQISATVKSYSF